jgi:immunoglobulin superfamily member 9B
MNILSNHSLDNFGVNDSKVRFFVSYNADPAKVTFTPRIQYLPLGSAGVVQCHIKANPPVQHVKWTKDRRLLEPYQSKDIGILKNGSLLFTRVKQNHQGRCTCEPYNAQGTQGSSGQMEVLVRNFSESVEMKYNGLEREGTTKPTIIENLETDFGHIESIASSTVEMTSSTELVVEYLEPHEAYISTATASEFSDTLSWMLVSVFVWMILFG